MGQVIPTQMRTLSTKIQAIFRGNSWPLICSVFLTLYYSAWITNGSFRLLRPMKYGLVFNNMLEHLLRWEFDVDPGLIEGEGFVHDGKAYAYFGILPALLRFPLLLAGRLEDVNVTILSCVLAAGISVFFKLAAIATISRAVSDRGSLYAVWLSVALAIALGGPELQFLDASIYQEVVNWAGALGSVFVYLAIRELLAPRNFPPSVLIAMAAIAGLEMITRISTATGLCLALALLTLHLAWRHRSDGLATSGREDVATAVARFVRAGWATPGILPALAILFAFGVAAGLVNLRTLGRPDDFRSHAVNLLNHSHEGRIDQLELQGAFNVDRLWFGFLDHFVPIWMLLRPDGLFLFEEFQRRMFHAIDLPPSSFLVSDPVLIVLTIYFFRRQFGAAMPQRIDRIATGAIAAGLAAPMVLILHGHLPGLSLSRRVPPLPGFLRFSRAVFVRRRPAQPSRRSLVPRPPAAALRDHRRRRLPHHDVHL